MGDAVAPIDIAETSRPKSLATWAVWRTLAAAALIGIGTGALYVTRLDTAPVYLAHDEVQFARQAYSLLTTGADLVGQHRPLYFSERGFTAGREPMSIYLTAALLSFRPLTTTTIRLPTAVVGVLNVLLMFALARYLFKRDSLASVAAIILALTPAHFIYSRFAVDVVYPLPFAMVWLLGLAAYFERRTLGPLVGAAGALGAGVYSYLVATILMPMYWGLTAIALLWKRSFRPLLVASAVFCAALLPLLLWHAMHPERYAELVSSYHLYDAHRFNPLQGAKDVFSYFGMGVRVDTYWNSFNPSILFFSGDPSVMVSTRQVGTFLLPMAILLPLGLHALWTRRRTPFHLILIGALLLSPIPAVMTAEVASRRTILMLPLAALIATYGVESLVRHRRRWPAIVAVALIGFMPFQFTRFYRDYFGDHRQRSGYWFGGNIIGGMDELVRLQSDPSRPSAHLSNAIWYVDEYWPYTLATHHREALLERSVYFDARTLDPVTLPARTLLMIGVGDPLEARLTAAEWSKIRVVPDAGGAPSLVIYERR